MTFSSKYNIDKSMFFTPPRSLNLPINRVLRRTLTLSGMVAALHAMPVLANNYAEVGKLTQGAIQRSPCQSECVSSQAAKRRTNAVLERVNSYRTK